MKDVGVGLIGTGFMGKSHALAWNAVRQVFGEVPAIRLAHLAEVDAGLAHQRAQAFGFAKSTADWRDLLRDPDVDVISLTAPNAWHAEMAVAALEAGKHVWCEKPMAPQLAQAVAMRDAARRTGKTAVLGYNYIQSPMLRQISRLLDEGAIGAVNHVRIEMDEDFMADPSAPFSWRNEESAGYGALDDFAVHPLSLIWTLFGRVTAVMCHQARPYAERSLPQGGTRKVETHDIASVLLRLKPGISGVLMVNRAAWGRKGRIAVQIFGSAGSIVFDQERMNELQVYRADADPREAGYRTILAAPAHPPYDRFVPAPGHGLGFNDLKIIECRELLSRLQGAPARIVDFEKGVEIERAVHAMAQSHAKGGWIEIDYD